MSSPLQCESGSPRFHIGYTNAMPYHLRSYRINPQCISWVGALYVPVILLSLCVPTDFCP